MSKKIPERSEIAIQDQWALEDLYATDELWQEDLKKLQAEIDELAGFAGRISQSAQELLAYLRLDDEINVAMGRIFNYAQRKCDEDTRVSKYQDFVSQAMSVYVAISSASAWFTPELLSLSEAQMAA